MSDTQELLARLKSLSIRCQSPNPRPSECAQMTKGFEDAIEKIQSDRVALEQERWRSVKDEPPPESRRCIVTNNPGALDAHGQMSHIWITFPILSSEEPTKGQYVGFDAADRQIWNITHWRPLPQFAGINGNDDA